MKWITKCRSEDVSCEYSGVEKMFQSKSWNFFWIPNNKIKKIQFSPFFFFFWDYIHSNLDSCYGSQTFSKNHSKRSNKQYFWIFLHCLGHHSFWIEGWAFVKCHITFVRGSFTFQHFFQLWALTPTQSLFLWVFFLCFFRSCATISRVMAATVIENAADQCCDDDNHCAVALLRMTCCLFSENNIRLRCLSHHVEVPISVCSTQFFSRSFSISFSIA